MNTTYSNTSTENECILPNYARITGLGLIGTIMLLGATGNVAVCIILGIFKEQLNSASQLFVVNIAISDLLTTLAVMPFDLVYWSTFPVFPLSTRVCRLWNALYFAFLSASSIGIGLIGIDIFLAVTKPLHYASIVTKQKAYFVITMAWIWSCTVGILIYFFQKEPPQNEYLFDLHPIAYGLYLVVHIALPSLAIPALYAKLFCIARQHAKRTEPLDAVPTNINQPNQKRLSIKRQLSMAKTFFLITIGFFICWYPFFIVQMFYVFKLDEKVDWCKLETADTIVCWLGYAQCCINPILYVFRRKTIRQVIRSYYSNRKERKDCTQSIKSSTS